MTKRTHSRLGAPPFMVGSEFALAERVKGCGLLTGMAANQKKMLIMTKRTHFVGGRRLVCPSRKSPALRQAQDDDYLKMDSQL